MTIYTEVASKVKQLSQAEKLALLRLLVDALEDGTPLPTQPKQASAYQPGKFTPTSDSSLLRVLGSLRQEGQPAPTDAEVEQMLVNYLNQKHHECAI